MAKGVFNWTYLEVVRFLKDNGFIYSHVEGSHYFYTGSFGHQPRIVTVPFHGSKAFKPKTFKGIVLQSGIPLERWLK